MEAPEGALEAASFACVVAIARAELPALEAAFALAVFPVAWMPSARGVSDPVGEAELLAAAAASPATRSLCPGCPLCVICVPCAPLA